MSDERSWEWETLTIERATGFPPVRGGFLIYGNDNRIAPIAVAGDNEELAQKIEELAGAFFVGENNDEQ